jgi:hypothetical protein
LFRRAPERPSDEERFVPPEVTPPFQEATMTRTLPLVTAALILAAAAPLLAARALGNLETRTNAQSSCLDTPRVEMAPKPAPKAEAGFCMAEASEVLP